MLNRVHLLLFLAFALPAFPLAIREASVVLPLARRLKPPVTRTILEYDQERARALKSVLLSRSGETWFTDVTNRPLSHTVPVSIGNPPTTFDLVIDTASANMWVGAATPYVPTSTSTDTGDKVSVKYRTGNMSGEEFVDTISTGNPALVIPQQSIGVAAEQSGFTLDGVDGVLGLGPTGLTAGTLSSGDLIPTIIDNALTLGLTGNKQVGIGFQPTTRNIADVDGDIAIGGFDPRRFIGEIPSVPFTTTSPASNFVGFDQSVTYGSSGASVLSTTAGIVDSSSTLLLLASDAFANYVELTGAVLDETTGFLTVTSAQYNNLQSLFFNIGGVSYELTRDAQTWPTDLNSFINGTTDGIYLVIGDLGSNSGEGLDFINGVPFLQRYYMGYDLENKVIGFAETEFTFADTNFS